MSTIDQDVDAAIQALQSVKLFSNSYGTNQKAFDGIRAVANALDFDKSPDASALRSGVAAAIRQSCGPVN